jgi:riboflavin synthase
MFTGIVEETGAVAGIKPSADSIQFNVRMRLCARGLRIGDSLAINGCCLTAVKISRAARSAVVRFELLKETWDGTNLQFAEPGSLVNLERSLSVNGRLGGHFVTGHIDGTGTITRLQRVGKDRVLEVSASKEVMDYVIQKGSIALDGISLTVAHVRKGSFGVWIIPHTWEVTALQERRAGDRVNLEADLLGKYVRQFISSVSKS